MPWLTRNLFLNKFFRSYKILYKVIIQFDHVRRIRVSEGLSPGLVWCGQALEGNFPGTCQSLSQDKALGTVKLFCGSFDSGDSGYLFPKSVLALKWKILGLLQWRELSGSLRESLTHTVFAVPMTVILWLCDVDIPVFSEYILYLVLCQRLGIQRLTGLIKAPVQEGWEKAPLQPLRQLGCGLTFLTTVGGSPDDEWNNANS